MFVLFIMVYFTFSLWENTSILISEWDKEVDCVLFNNYNEVLLNILFNMVMEMGCLIK